MQEKSVSEAIYFRRSVRIYDPTKLIETEKVKKCIDQAILSPSSSNMQLWEFHHIISEDFKNKQEELLLETLKKIDIIICTALIPGKEAPKIIKEEMFKNLQQGSVIYDLAAIQGGNTAFTEVDKIIEKNGIKILGEANILNKLPVSSSNLYAKNVFNFISNLYDKENKKLNINLEDEIIEKTLIK